MSEVVRESDTIAPLRHAALLTALLAVGASLGQGRALGPIPLLGGVLAYLGVVALVPSLRRSRPPLRVGSPSRGVVVQAIFVAVGTIAALGLWKSFAAPDLSDLRALVPPLGTGGLIALGVSFALLNAAGEELIFRGVLLPALEQEFGGVVGVGLHAIVFGAVHAQSGFPRGLSGFGLVTLYGVLLASLARRSGGLLVPWLVHVTADATIFWLVVA